jgi:hypothetical protein
VDGLRKSDSCGQSCSLLLLLSPFSMDLTVEGHCESKSEIRNKIRLLKNTKVRNKYGNYYKMINEDYHFGDI